MTRNSTFTKTNTKIKVSYSAVSKRTVGNASLPQVPTKLHLTNTFQGLIQSKQVLATKANTSLVGLLLEKQKQK